MISLEQAKKDLLDDLNKLNELGIVYESINMKLVIENGEYVYKKDYPGRYAKQNPVNEIGPYSIEKLNGKPKTTIYNKYKNSSVIYLGKYYNTLIGIDVDNKDNTIEKFNEDISEEERNTLTLTTMNDGYHYYYRLTEEQERKLDEINFRHKNDCYKDLHVDIKYTNQIFFGPSYINPDENIGNNPGKILQYKIINAKEPIILPDLIFEQIIEKNTNKKTKNVKTKKDKNNNKEEEIINLDETKENDKDEEIRKYLDLLPSKYYENYDLWFGIGSIIYNEKGSIDLFHDFSKKSNKYDKEEVNNKWIEYKKYKGDRKKTIRSLSKYIKQDNPDKIKELNKITKSSLINLVKNNDLTDHDLSIYLHLMYNDKFVYSGKTWYCINKYNIWTELEEEDMMTSKISKLVAPIVTNIKDELDNEKTSKQIYKYYDNLVKKFLNHTNLTKILKMCKDLFYDKEFSNKANNVNPNLFAFTNGCYDLKNMEFRLPNPNEFITINCGYEYIPYISSPQNVNIEKVSEETKKETCKGVKLSYEKILEESKKIRECKKHIYKIVKSMHDNQTSTDYLLLTISQCLSGLSLNEKLYSWNGNGRNGKGVLLYFMKYTFGEYFHTFPIEYFTKESFNNSKGADEVMAGARYARIALTTEPEAGIELKTARLKKISGSDPESCRKLFKGQFEFIPKFKLFIQSNQDLHISGTEKAITDRLQVLDFPFSFVEKPINSKQKLIDKTIKNKILDNKYYRIAFFHILSDYYFKYQYIYDFNIKIPKTVEKSTEIAFCSIDNFSYFFSKQITVTENKIDKVAAQVLYNTYVSFCKKNFPGNAQIINMPQFKANMISKGLQQSNANGLVVWRFIILDKVIKSDDEKKNEIDLVNSD